MSTAIQLTDNLTQWSVFIPTGQTATRGYPAVWHGTANEAKNASADTDEAFGFFDRDMTGPGQVAVNLAGPVIRVTVGTGGATRGKKAVFSGSFDGMTDAPAQAAGGATENNIYGVFMQTGVVGDTIGMMQAIGNRVST